MPQWSCTFAVSGAAGAAYGPAAVASYLAATLTAGGQEWCASQPSPSGFCDATLGVTGLCAVAPAPGPGGNGTLCRLTPGAAIAPVTMTASLASPGVDCPPSGKKLSAAAQTSLLASLAAYMPGFRLSLPQAKQNLQCVQQYVS